MGICECTHDNKEKCNWLLSYDVVVLKTTNSVNWISFISHYIFKMWRKK